MNINITVRGDKSRNTFNWHRVCIDAHRHRALYREPSAPDELSTLPCYGSLCLSSHFIQKVFVSWDSSSTWRNNARVYTRGAGSISCLLAVVRRPRASRVSCYTLTDPQSAVGNRNYLRATFEEFGRIVGQTNTTIDKTRCFPSLFGWALFYFVFLVLKARV